MAAVPRIGQNLGPYRLLEQIGAGGMGVVLRAHDERLDRDVALKVLPQGPLADDHARHRFRKEALALSRLNHPNIETVHEFDTQAGIDFLVLELVPGISLDGKLAAGPLPEKEVMRLGAQLAEGLAAAHDKGVLHRDLKPANLRVTPEGRLKILDFGLAKFFGSAGEAAATESLTQAQGVLGTLPYMAPEQLRGEEADARSDIYGAGAVLYEMATGQRPFPKSHAPLLVNSILNQAPTPPSAVNRRLATGLENVILKCLDKDPERRYQSAKELLVDLQRLSAAGPVIAPAKPVRRRWLATAVVGTALAVAVVWSALSFQARRRQGRERSVDVQAGRLTTGGAASKVPEANEYFEKGMVFLSTEYDLTHARQMLERALQLDPHFAEARGWYGFTDVLMIDSGYSNDSNWYYKAEAEFRQALQDDPNSARAHAGLAAAYLLQGRKELAPAELERALAVAPNDLDTRVWLFNYHNLSGEYGKAQALAEEVLHQAPVFFPARMNLGDILREQGNTAGAIREYEKILELDGQNVYALVRLARAHMESGDVVRARRTLELARPAERRNYHARLAWALLLALEGKRSEALKEMDEELSKFAVAQVWATLPVAEFYAALNDIPKSLDWLERAVRSGDERAEWFERDPLLAKVRPQARFRQVLDSIAYRRQQRKHSPVSRF